MREAFISKKFRGAVDPLIDRDVKAALQGVVDRWTSAGLFGTRTRRTMTDAPTKPKVGNERHQHSWRREHGCGLPIWKCAKCRREELMEERPENGIAPHCEW